MAASFNEIASFTWSVADLLRDDYKQSDYGAVILPFTLLHRLDCVLEQTKPAVQAEFEAKKGLGIDLRTFPTKKAGQSFYNTFPFDFAKLLGDPAQIKLSDKGKQAIKLEQNAEEYKLRPLTSVGSGKPYDPETTILSEIIQKMNDLFEGDLTENDLLALANHVGGKMMESETLAQQAAANTKLQFGASPDYKAIMMESVADGPDKYQETAKQVLNSSIVQDGLAEVLLELVYAGFAKRRDIQAPPHSHGT